MSKLSIKLSSFLSLIGLMIIFVSAKAPLANAATTVTSHTTNTTSVGQYNKFEVTFQISRQFPTDSLLPYYFYDPTDTQPITAFPKPGPVGADGITIDGHFISPSGKEVVVPAFYMREYTRGSGYRINLTNNYAWKLRFAPEEVGQYQFFITIQDKNGSSRYPSSGTQTFQSSSSNSKGFVRKSTADPRFYEFDNGESFIPNAAAAQWFPGDGRSSSYEQLFSTFKSNNINFTRVWDQNDGYGLTVEGPYDAYPDNFPEAWGLANKDSEAIQVQKGTQMNQRGNAEEDIMIDSAAQNGVYIQLCAHGDPYWIWDASVYGEGWNLNEVNWDHQKHVNYWKRNLRYRVARWGYSTSIFGWEIWNEHSHISVDSTLYKFYQQIGNYLNSTDPYNHFLTTSQGSQAWSPGFWAMPQMDIANYHDYMMVSRYSTDLAKDATNFVYRFAQCLRTTNGRASGCGLGIGDGSSWADPNSKPIIWGELDTGTNNWNESNPQPTARLNMRWAGLFSPVGMAPVDWYYESWSSSEVQKKYSEAKIAGDFFKDIKYDKAKFNYLSTSDVRITAGSITSTNSKIRVLGMRSQDTQQLYAYAQHSDFKWANGTSVPSAVSGQFSVGGMRNGQYSVEYWDTSSGAKTTASATASGGNITIPVNNLSKNVAIKIRHSDYDPTQPTAVPTQVPSSCPTDINQDNITDISDYAIIVANFLKTNPSNPRADINTDGIVDISDYALLVQKFLQTCN